jgi:hypothetical protein
VRPLAQLQNEAPTDRQAASLLNARQIFGLDELEAIRKYHADTIRFQISQPALDPASDLYDPQYFSDVKSAIQTARANGFVVMVMMQDEMITGNKGQDPLPSMETQNDWDLFTKAFGSDRGVVFEVYNEPALTASVANWQLWLNGGKYKDSSYLGMQTLVDHLRGSGAQNVLVVDGLGVVATDPLNPNQPVQEAAATLENVPIVKDPLGRIVYAVHPYQHGLSDESAWDAEFGTPSTMLPVWADEWSAATGLALGLGNLPDYHIAVDFLNYARAHSISICTGAFDVNRFVVQQVPSSSQQSPSWPLNSYANYSASSTTEGSGTLVYNTFANNFSRLLAIADGL